MRKVIGIGETVLDIIFRGGQPIGAVPGGSVFNGVISLGRAGVPAAFISEAGNDRVGDTIVQFLRENGVNGDNVNRYPDSKSPSIRTIRTTSWTSSIPTCSPTIL